MKCDLREFAKIGVVHHLLYPKCMNDPDDHVRTLLAHIRRTDIETLDCCIPYGKKRRDKLIPAVRDCGKEVIYTMHLFPLRKISLATSCPQEQAFTRLIIEDQINLAADIGAVGFITGSGADVLPEQRPIARQAFADFCKWFCSKLKPHGMTAMLEPFDRYIDKKFLYGPTEECVDLIESLRPEVDNLAIELDVGHLPLMGESFEHAIKITAPYLKRVHISNCVKNDPASPWYGDLHPPLGIEGGEIDVPQLTEVLRRLLDVGYLNRKTRGALVLEIQPFPDKTEEETARDNLRRLRTAWENV